MTHSKSKIQNPKFSLPRYPRYKDSGFEWLGEVPEHWDVQSLRAVAGLYVEKNQPDLPVLSVYREYGVILKDSRDDNHNATSLDTSNYKVVRPGDLAVNKMKAWQGSLGVSEHHGIVSPAYITCRLNQEKVTGRYIHYLLRSKSLIGALDSISYGVRVGQWDMRFEDFKKVGITIPPKPEQDRIVAFLDQKTAEIDALIAKKQRQIELLDEQKTILINRAVSRICLTDVDVKFPTVGKLIQKQELTIQDGNHGELHPVSADYVDVGIPFLMASDVRPEEVNLATCAKLPEKKARKLRIGFALAGDVILTHKATIGQVGKLPDVLDSPFVMLSPQTTYYRPLPGRIKSEYLFQLLQTAYVQEQLAVLALNQSTRGYVGLIAQKRMILPIPSNQSQVRFESEARAIQQKTSSVRSRFQSQIEQLQSFRSTLIAHAVTGRIKI